MHTSPNTHSQEDKNNLARTLALVCVLQQQYGKTPAELEMLVEGFSRVLKHHSMDRIIDAIEKYTLKNPNIPSPADVENIITPPPPKIDWPLYIELKKKLRQANVYVDRDEKQFVRNCEELAILHQRGEMANYTEAQKQLESHSNMMIANEF